MQESSSNLKTVRMIEATIGAFFSFAFGLALAVASCVVGYAMWTGPERWLCSLLVIPNILELWFLYRLKVKLEEGHYPFSPYFALQFQNWPLLLRPFAAVWWLAHFAAGIGATILVDNILVLSMTDWNTRVLRSLIFIPISFTIAYSANLYLLLLVTAAGGGKRAVGAIWRYRILLDLAVAICAAFFPILSRGDLESKEKPIFPPASRQPNPWNHTRPATTRSGT
jgi:hypothetical protein